MPTWCYSYLEISGEVDAVEEFMAPLKAKGETNSGGEFKVSILDTFDPCPDELDHLLDEHRDGRDVIVRSSKDDPLKDEEILSEEARQALLEKYGHDNWWDWCNAHYHTKWPDDSIILRDRTWGKDNKYRDVIIRAMTAWGPIFDALKRLHAEKGWRFSVLYTWVRESADGSGADYIREP